MASYYFLHRHNGSHLILIPSYQGKSLKVLCCDFQRIGIPFAGDIMNIVITAYCLLIQGYMQLVE